MVNPAPRSRCAQAALLLLTTLLLNCDDASPGPASPPEVPEARSFTHDAYGVSFEIPGDWTEAPHGDSIVFSGARGSDGFFTTMTLQAVPRSARGLEAALLAAYGAGTEDLGISWEAREPVVVAGHPGLSYRMTFTWHETPRRRTGVLVDTGALFVDLSYAADASLFDRGLPVFVRSAESLSVF